MDDTLYAMKTDFYISLDLEEKSQNSFDGSALHILFLRDVIEILTREKVKHFFLTDYSEFAMGEKRKGVKVTIMHPYDDDADEPNFEATLQCDRVAQKFRSNFHLGNVLVIHSEVAGKLVTGKEIPDA